eukprot:s4484_g4.t1
MAKSQKSGRGRTGLVLLCAALALHAGLGLGFIGRPGAPGAPSATPKGETVARDGPMCLDGWGRGDFMEV